jgi:hypothetical protein
VKLDYTIGQETISNLSDIESASEELLSWFRSLWKDDFLYLPTELNFDPENGELKGMVHAGSTLYISSGRTAVLNNSESHFIINQFTVALCGLAYLARCKDPTQVDVIKLVGRMVDRSRTYEFHGPIWLSSSKDLLPVTARITKMTETSRGLRQEQWCGIGPNNEHEAVSVSFVLQDDVHVF